jgi:outer membrane lipoprotein-sorting protein
LGLPRLALVAAFLLLWLTPAVRADDALLSRWFATQAEIKTWSADFIQTRTLKALKEPLQTPGRVWFTTPDRFRWELGEPAQTIALREADAMVIVYPRLKRAERYALDEPGAGQWRDALTLLEAGFPRSRADLEKQFKIESFTTTGDAAELVLQPRSSRARKLIAQVRLVIGSADLQLRATELRFADGSRMRNDFSDARINPPLDAGLFTAVIPEDFKVSEPLAGRAR